MDREEIILGRIRKCRDLVNSGVPKRKAYPQAHTDAKTYKKYLPILESKELRGIPMNTIEQPEILSESISEIPNEITKTVAVNTLISKRQIIIRLPNVYYDLLLQEVEETGIPLSNITASYVIGGLRKKYNIK